MATPDAINCDRLDRLAQRRVHLLRAMGRNAYARLLRANYQVTGLPRGQADYAARERVLRQHGFALVVGPAQAGEN